MPLVYAPIPFDGLDIGDIRKKVRALSQRFHQVLQLCRAVNFRGGLYKLLDCTKGGSILCKKATWL